MNQKKMTTRERQAQETRKRILRVATQLIIQKGFDNVTLMDITRQAGISKALFYHYFQSKADIIVEAVKLIDADFVYQLTSLPADISPMEMIIFILTETARYAKKWGVGFTIQIYKCQLEVDMEFFLSKNRPILKAIRDCVVALQQEGALSEAMPADEHARYIMASARGIIYDWCLHNGSYDVEAAMDSCFRKLIFSNVK